MLSCCMRCNVSLLCNLGVAESLLTELCYFKTWCYFIQIILARGHHPTANNAFQFKIGKTKTSQFHTVLRAPTR